MPGRRGCFIRSRMACSGRALLSLWRSCSEQSRLPPTLRGYVPFVEEGMPFFCLTDCFFELRVTSAPMANSILPKRSSRPYRNRP